MQRPTAGDFALRLQCTEFSYHGRGFCPAGSETPQTQSSHHMFRLEEKMSYFISYGNVCPFSDTSPPLLMPYEIPHLHVFETLRSAPIIKHISLSERKDGMMDTDHGFVRMVNERIWKKEETAGLELHHGTELPENQVAPSEIADWAKATRNKGPLPDVAMDLGLNRTCSMMNVDDASHESASQWS